MIREIVESDQIKHECWTLPAPFYELEPRVMEAIVCSMFPTCLSEEDRESVRIDIPAPIEWHARAEHSASAQLAFLNDTMEAARVAWHARDGVVQQLVSGDVVIPIVNKDSLFEGKLYTLPEALVSASLVKP